MTSKIFDLESCFNASKNFSDLNECMKGCQIKFVAWKGRKISKKDSSTTVELADLSRKVTNFYLTQGCSASERKDLSSLVQKIQKWYNKTDKAYKNEGRISQFIDRLKYGYKTWSTFGAKSKWSIFYQPDLANHYTIQEWEREFPDVKMPKASRYFTHSLDARRHYHFSDEQLKLARDDQAEINQKKAVTQSDVPVTH